jgi:hypothetical protein
MIVVGNKIACVNNFHKTIIPLHMKKCDVAISLIKKQYVNFETPTQKAAIKVLMELMKDRA